MSREELIRKISTEKAEMEHCGPIHRRDLQKHVRRMEKELRILDHISKQTQKTHIST